MKGKRPRGKNARKFNGKRRHTLTEVPRYKGKDGHVYVNLETYAGSDLPVPVRVDEMVACTFIGPCPPGHQLIHKDGQKDNCTAGNLEYVPINN